MKTKIKHLLFFVILVLFQIHLNGQTLVAKTLTVVPFSDTNNNCVYDVGEDTLVHFKIQASDNATFMGASGDSDCAGTFTAYINVPATSMTYSIQLIEGLVQPCAIAAYSNIPYFTKYYLPLKPSIKNAAPAIGTIFYSGSSGKVFSYAKTDSFPACNNGLKLLAGVLINNNTQCVVPTYTGVLTAKIDGATVDTYTFTSNVTTATPFTSAASTGTIYFNQTYQLNVNYNFPNSLVSAGNHTATISFSPFSGYSQPTVLSWILLTDSCGAINGQTYLDCNSNCTKDSWETYSGNPSRIDLTNATNTISTYPNTNGTFNINAAVGIYTVNVVGLQSNHIICPVTNFTTNITNLSTYTLNYGVQETSAPSYFDNNTWLGLFGANPGPGAVPGGTLGIKVATNLNAATLCSTPFGAFPTALKVALPPEFTYVNVIGSSPFPIVISAPTGDTLVWNYPGPNSLLMFSVYTKTTAVIGNSYCVKSIVYPLNDSLPYNNTFSDCRLFGGPFDPNAKHSEAIGMAANGDILPGTKDITYTIEFQNLGTGKAINVNINDTIDTNLNLSTLEIISSSSPVTTQVFSSTRAVNFKFANINLPAASSNEPASHGFVRYKIKLNTGLPLGTKINNRAHIYFDFNPAVATNKTINTIVLVTGVNELKISELITLYPNPTSGDVNIKTAVSVLRLEVMNSIGQLVLSKNNIQSTSSIVDLSSLTQGVYFLRLQTEKGIIIKKLIKE